MLTCSCSSNVLEDCWEEFTFPVLFYALLVFMLITKEPLHLGACGALFVESNPTET